MSKKHPIVVITGSSGAGTSTVKKALVSIFLRQKIKSVVVEGDSFHRYDRAAMQQKMDQAIQAGQNFSHFGPGANELERLADLFETYGETGGGQKRYYLHDHDEARAHNRRLGLNLDPGQFTPWEDIEAGTDMMFYEGLHGLVKTDEVDLTRHVDLKVGVVPIVNLEWIQKIHRDNADRGYSEDVIVDNILRRMPDYVKYITPQFSQTDINFQRVATVDTSNPFIARDIPTLDESFVVIHIRNLEKIKVDFQELLKMLNGSFMTKPNTIVVPAGKMIFAMQLITNPLIQDLMKNKNSSK
jgi:phosphoribulokinase